MQRVGKSGERPICSPANFLRAIRNYDNDDGNLLRIRLRDCKKPAKSKKEEKMQKKGLFGSCDISLVPFQKFTLKEAERVQSGARWRAGGRLRFKRGCPSLPLF